MAVIFQGERLDGGLSLSFLAFNGDSILVHYLKLKTSWEVE